MCKKVILIKLIYYPETPSFFVHLFSDTIKPWQASNSCDTGTSALPDMYAGAQGHTAPKGKCGHIRQSTSACVTTNALHFW